MSDLAAGEEVAIRHTRSRSGGLRTRINNRLAMVLLLIVFAAPVAIGSNRPLAWAVWAFLVGLVSLVVGIAMVMSGERLRFSMGRLKFEIALFAAVVLYLCLQLLPIGSFAIPNVDGLTMATTQISVAPGATVMMILRMLTYGLFAFLVLQAAVNASRRKMMLDVMLMIVVVHALYALLALFQFGDTLLGGPKWSYYGSATGTFVNRNSFSTFLAFGAAIASASLASAISGSRRAGDTRQGVGSNGALYLLALVILLVTVIATNSRMGVLVWIVAAVIPMVLLMSKTALPRAVVSLAMVAVTAVAILAIVLYGASLLDRVGNLEDNSTIRTTLYAQVQQMIAARPWIGFGGGSFENAFHLFHQPDLAIDSNWDRAHNSYLALWSELGLIAGSLPVIILALIAWRIRGSLRRENGSWTAQAAALAVICAGGLHSLVDFSLEIQGVTFLFLAICAAGLAATATSRET